MTELKPCPWCRDKNAPQPWAHFWHVVRCQKCLCEGPAADTEDQAIAAWNTRAAEKD